jgi:hypothetical protein
MEKLAQFKYVARKTTSDFSKIPVLEAAFEKPVCLSQARQKIASCDG